jgi:hypothetical protein
MNILKQTRFYFITLISFIIILSIKYIDLENRHKKYIGINYEDEFLKNQFLVDSLRNEIFIMDIETGSYRVMWEILEEINPNLADSINSMVE